jgi:hypothetical protein
VLFDGLMRQSEINRVLDKIFDDLEEASLDEAEDVVLALYEEGQRENADYFALLTA